MEVGTSFCFKDFSEYEIQLNKTTELGKTSINENIVVDSRLAWHFIPNSFKVFLDVDWITAGNRLIGANRETENGENLEDAIIKLKDRWQTGNKCKFRAEQNNS